MLELAAGIGETGLPRREPLGKKGPLISSDFSPQMVHTVEHVAKELGISDAEFRMLDAERIELDDAGVDALLCRYSYMLFSEPLLLRRYWRRPVEDPNGGDEWAPVTDGCESAVRRPERTMRRSGTRPSGRSA